MAKQGLTLVSFACNDYRNGNAQGHVLQVECKGLHLESPYVGKFLKCEVEKDFVRIGSRRWWPARGVVRWYGNWCWDAAWMTYKDAAELMTFVRGKGYRPDSGPTSLFHKEKFFAIDLIEVSDD